LLCAGCSHMVWATSSEIAPSSYVVRDLPIERQVGRLRRLALMPVAFKFERGHDHSTTNEAGEAKYRREISEYARAFLVDWRGYEVETVGDCPADDMRELAAWASSSDNDATPPDERIRLVSAVGLQYRTDGVMVIQGHLKILSNPGLVIIIATCGLAWPIVLPADSDAGIRADLFEVSSARIVWRDESRDWIGDPNGRNPSLLIECVLAPLEHAVPKVLTSTGAARYAGAGDDLQRKAV